MEQVQTFIDTINVGIECFQIDSTKLVIDILKREHENKFYNGYFITEIIDVLKKSYIKIEDDIVSEVLFHVSVEFSASCILYEKGVILPECKIEEYTKALSTNIVKYKINDHMSVYVEVMLLPKELLETNHNIILQIKDKYVNSTIGLRCELYKPSIDPIMIYTLVEDKSYREDVIEKLITSYDAMLKKMEGIDTSVFKDILYPKKKVDEPRDGIDIKTFIANIKKYIGKSCYITNLSLSDNVFISTEESPKRYASDVIIQFTKYFIMLHDLYLKLTTEYSVKPLESNEVVWNMYKKNKV